MDYLLAQIALSLVAAFVIGLIAGRMLRALGPARGGVGDRATIAEKLSAERESEARHLREEMALANEKLRRAEAAVASAQADAALSASQLSTTRADFSRKILSLEDEIAALKKVKPMLFPEAAPAGAPTWMQPQTAPQPAHAPVSAPIASPAPAMEAAMVASAAVPQPAPPPPQPAPAALPPDDLKEISGIGPILEHTLQSLGIRSFAQIARITPEDVAMLIVKVDSSIAERVLRERWVEQARELYVKKYGRAP